MSEKQQQLADQDLVQATGGDSMEYFQEDRIRHKYQCPKCNGTSFTRGIKISYVWFIKRKVEEWLECTTCGAHYPINGKNSLIMLE